MKFIFSILLFASVLFSSTLNNSILEIHATLMPKILLLENNIEKKIKNNVINITIAYEKTNYNEMKFFKQAINRKYPEGISGYEIKINVIEYANLKECSNETNAVYVFPSSKENIDNIVQKYKSCHTVTFAYDKNYLSNNVMLSISLDKKVKPIINLKAVKDSGISFRPILLSISKVYKNDK
ncbi:YfiR/HmsC family protein [Sulfurimonas sp.]|uniref:YfiR/HmsC family protein n=1 Tax=Sulfurimonas sp. TaxID=2022749 RepID=UPI0035678986